MSELYKIGQVSKICEISIKTLRFYEDEGLIKPVKVDIYSGYRLYDEKNLVQIFMVKFLRSVGFSIKEIRDFDKNSINKKIEDIENQISKLKDNRKMLSFLKKQKGEIMMKNFINDENAVGKWAYVATVKSKKAYLDGEFEIKKDEMIKILYFLPQGQGYWIFDRWTKGQILHFRGDVFKYEIEDGKLFLNVECDEVHDTLVFEKVDSKAYTDKAIRIEDNVKLPFVLDKEILGLWTALDFILVENKNDYKPKEKARTQFLKSATFNPNGEVIFESENGLYKNCWTKGKVLNINDKTASEYQIKKIDGKYYLFMDWKSGDYMYQGLVKECIVFKQN